MQTLKSWTTGHTGDRGESLVSRLGSAVRTGCLCWGQWRALCEGVDWDTDMSRGILLAHLAAVQLHEHVVCCVQAVGVGVCGQAAALHR
jgi:hypothetical protein